MRLKMNLTRSQYTIDKFANGLKEYIEVNGAGMAAGYMYGVISNFNLNDGELDLLDTFTKGMKESVERTLSNASRPHQQHVIDA
jgi:hypothetical protein